MALCNNLAPPFDPSATLSPSISLPATPPWHFTNQLTPHSELLWVCDMFKVFLSLFCLCLPFRLGSLSLSLMTKSLLPSTAPPPVYLHLPAPSGPQPFCESLIDTFQYAVGIKSFPKLATNISAMLIYRRWPSHLSQREAAVALAGCM